MKKICSFLLAICLFAVPVLGNMGSMHVKAEDNFSESSTHEILSLNDLGIQDNTYGSTVSGMASMDKVEMRGKVTFPTEGAWNDPYLYIGTHTASTTSGLHLFYNGVNAVGVQVPENNNASLGSVEITPGSEVEFSVAFEYMENGTDVYLVIVINETTLYEGVCAGFVGKFGRGFRIGASATKPLKIASVDTSATQEGYHAITFSDCGLVDGTYTENKSGMAIDDVKIVGNYTFPSGGAWGSPGVFIGARGYGKGCGLHFFSTGSDIRIQDTVNGDSYLQYNGSNSITAGDLNVAAIPGISLKIEVLFQWIEGTSNVNVTIFINEVECYNGIRENWVGNIGPGVTVSASGDKQVTLSSPSDGTETPDEPEEPIEYNSLTFSDFGIADGSYTSTSGVAASGTAPGVDSLHNVEIKGMVTFPIDGAWSDPGLFIGSTGRFGFHIFYSNNMIYVQDAPKNNVTVCTVTTDQVGKALAGRAVAIAMAFTCVGEDLHYTFSIDGVQYGTGVSEGSATSYQPAVCLYALNKPIKVGSITKIAEDGTISEFRKLTLSDFGLSSGDYTSHTKKTAKSSDSLLNTILTLDVEWTGETNEASSAGTVFNPWICYGGIPSGANAYWGGVVLRMSETEIEVVSTDNISGALTAFKIPASFIEAESFHNKAFRLAIAFKKSDLDKDGECNDVELGIYMNGKLYNDSYIPMKDVAYKLGNTLSFFPDPNHGTGNAILRVGDVVHTTDSFETLTLSDFGVKPDVYRSNNDGYSVGSEGTYEGSVNGKIFKNNIKFGFYDSKLLYGGITIGTERPVEFNPAYKKFKISFAGNTQEIYAKDAGVQLAERIFELGISGRNVDCDGDGAIDDYEVGIWFDGKLYKNQYYYLQDAKDFLTSNIAVYCADRPVETSPHRGPIDGDGYVAIGDIVQTSPVESSYCTDEFAYMVDGDAITINGTSYTEAQGLLNPGVYDITYTERNSTYMDKVTIYKSYDATADGEVNLRDLMAAKKFEAGKRTLNASGQLALMIVDGSLPATIYADMRSVLLASKDIIGTKDMSEDLVGAMGPDASLTGSYITDVQKTEEGTAIISISDTEGASWTSDVEALDGSGLDYILNFDTDREIRVLQITDTQMINNDYNSNMLSPSSYEKGELTEESRKLLLYNELDTLIETTKPDLILLTGDNTYGKFDLEGKELQTLADYLDSYRIPWAPINGNHDQEITAGINGICEIYENAKYCLYTRRGEIGGAGNYAIGLAKQGRLERVFYMMDANGCWDTIQSDKDDYADGTYIGAQEFILFRGQIEWYRTVGAKVKAFAGKNVPSSLGIHIPPAEAGKTGKTSGDAIDYISGYMKEVGTDSVFFGHIHAEGWTAEYDGITYTCGMLTGGHMSGAGNDGKTGGTLININAGTIDIEHKVITERDVVTGMPITAE